jgi:isoaspartyl peptidase/L-asparaginase-like protein (Ntn-hydrolase superfamily)
MTTGSRFSQPIREHVILLLLSCSFCISICGDVPCVAVGTWHFSSLALEHAKGVLEAGGSALDAAERGINALELDTSEQTFVGYGGLPNAEGHMELDAAIMDGGHGMALCRIHSCMFASHFCMRAVYACEHVAVGRTRVSSECNISSLE